MISIKTPKEIEIMARAGCLLADIRQKLLESAHPGVTSQQIENLAQQLIKTAGGEPSFARVPNYNWATCININEGVVHGVPNNQPFKSGDLVSIDVGIYFKGFHSDCSKTIIVGDQKPPKKVKFLEIGRQTLKKAIQAARPGQRVGHISQAIETNLKKYNLSAIPHLTGHGIGRELHESPHIPGVVKQPIEQTDILKPGMTLAIEVIYTLGSGQTATSSDDHWTIITQDGKISGIFEETIAIKNDGPLILTKTSSPRK